MTILFHISYNDNIIFVQLEMTYSFDNLFQCNHGYKYKYNRSGDLDMYRVDMEMADNHLYLQYILLLQWTC
jgi:hypothetical protein